VDFDVCATHHNGDRPFRLRNLSKDGRFCGCHEPEAKASKPNHISKVLYGLANSQQHAAKSQSVFAFPLFAIDLLRSRSEV
jgi:hypothetical protein